VKEFRGNSPARSKNLKRYPEWIVPLSQLRRTIESATRELQNAKTQILDTYLATEQYKEEFLATLRPEIQRGLSFVHDYKQINSQIVQNMNVIIETRYEGVDFEEKLKKASHPEIAIYWGSKFLQEKLNVARFLIHPEWAGKESERRLFRFHGALIKYVRIYQYMFEVKHVRINVLGHSIGEVFGNPEAIGVIPHTLLDNALKYSPPGERVEVYVNDDRLGIEFSVASYGPRIEDDERTKIFHAFYRGVHARQVQEEGAGYGLYVAQLVAKVLRTEITVDQDANRQRDKDYWTTFRVLLPYA
jgi:signal transduction histidine kinase